MILNLVQCLDCYLESFKIILGKPPVFFSETSCMIHNTEKKSITHLKWLFFFPCCLYNMYILYPFSCYSCKLQGIPYFIQNEERQIKSVPIFSHTWQPSLLWYWLHMYTNWWHLLLHMCSWFFGPVSHLFNPIPYLYLFSDGELFYFFWSLTIFLI